MSDSARDLGLLKRIGARVLSEANDLKRTPEALARDLGLDQAEVRMVIAGEGGLDLARNLIHKMAEVYPISLRSLWLDPDDTDNGVRVFSAAQSIESSRVFDRKAADGALTPYYEYRDTAMSRAAPFKPEWIKELRVVSDSDPNNSDVAYNNGHLMHQTTFFIGPVNFYWEIDGVRHCAEMRTGDSNYITPFVPHSFTSRDSDDLGLIIAVTYGAGVADALDAFMELDSETTNRLAGDLAVEEAFAVRLRRHLAAESLTAYELADRLKTNGLDAGRVADLTEGRASPTTDETALIAECLSIRPADLMAFPQEPAARVVVRSSQETGERNFPSTNQPAYRLKELARTPNQPNLKGFDVTVLPGSVEGVFEHGLHEYVYNYGETAVEVHWSGDRMAVLQPGDSAYVKPMISHRFTCHDPSEAGRLVVVRIPGKLNDHTLDEYASFDSINRNRVSGETKRWF